jgi:hypothetical protein
MPSFILFSSGAPIWRMCLLIFGSALLALSVFLFIADTKPQPNRDQLLETSGVISGFADCQPCSSDLIKFNLEGSETLFQYPAWANGSQKVFEAVVALINSGDTVSILTHPPHDRPHALILEIRTETEMLRSFEQISRDRRGNNILGLAIALLFGSIGLTFALGAMFKRKIPPFSEVLSGITW